jgi:ABC-type polysaccharide/polyol phosphate transport system ATPase subunit
MALIHLDNISVNFPIYTSHTRSIRTALFSKLGGQLASHNNTVVVEAIKNLSLKLEDGDRLGLIGHNGAGKTSLLRVISGVYPPQQGEVNIIGKAASFTDITLGMDMEATGYENIIFRCVFLGLTFKEARELSPSIAEFSELGEFLDMPVRTYSTGMFVRLAFSISTSIEPDILIMDEMIGAGDQSFIEKAKARIDGLLEKTKILVISSHDMGIIQKICNKVMWLEKGEVKMMGSAEEVLAAYQG